ncbi:hypothetical protein N7448_000479 [Penicillium atrosanguineum]|uniref:Hydrophobin n=1 Tax=Penicillium atrosanguineum TaxID=1132637 RepID=A0A9W9Q693_9EURO|nr:uncharacterized protein N7443_003877 [Penicillium atrosanguineum]KAJ5134501.1 hypothetical protein N7526_005866 [Penicillium atrosanguineum]KAJ5148901.1 hypothetical protein N7448_000479 [Penicillium atrosanguineum]KAJ5304217.1 hypothetical protein N7443_003877 [Penicillium atrosanguineum]KAJ5323692.1 hypothetical protein N7476_002292 [Penicillium atrosanguineum]
MRFNTLFASISALVTVAVAIPVAQDPPTQLPTPSKPVIPSASTPYGTPSATPSMVGAYQCPPTQQKQCCQTLQETSHDVMKSLGALVPILGGITVSSKVTFQCKAMTPEESPDSCVDNEYIPMCCTNQSSNSIGQCKPFAEAKEAYYRSFGYGQESQTDYILDAID